MKKNLQKGILSFSFPFDVKRASIHGHFVKIYQAFVKHKADVRKPFELKLTCKWKLVEAITKIFHDFC